MEYLVALVPSAGVLFLFVVAIRAMLRADRTERAAVARLERERVAEEARVGTEHVTPEVTPDDGDRPPA